MRSTGSNLEKCRGCVQTIIFFQLKLNAGLHPRPNLDFDLFLYFDLVLYFDFVFDFYLYFDLNPNFDLHCDFGLYLDFDLSIVFNFYLDFYLILELGILYCRAWASTSVPSLNLQGAGDP